MGTKNKIMPALIALLILVIFNVVALALPFTRDNSFWVGYGFAMAAIILFAGVAFYVGGQKTLKSKIFGLPLIFIVGGYFGVQLVVGLIEMTINTNNVRYQLIINVILLAICLIGLIGTQMGREAIQGVDEAVQQKVFYIKSLQADVDGLQGQATDASLRKELKDLSETIRFSDPMSSPQLAALENKIEVKVAQLSANVEAQNTDAAKSDIAETQRLFAERNQKCKLLKSA
ncbi:MAG: hypothetical protein FWD65_04455 [Coriobacteriia bacterium]|nr:hypothetical protein [Coriobacteriia bacterium]